MRMSVIEWLLDSDPSIRWQVMRDLIAESDETVGEIMTPSILAVDEEMPIGKVAAKMIDARIHRLLVTRDRKIVGILSTTDLLGLLVDVEEN